MAREKQCSVYVPHGPQLGSYCEKGPTSEVNGKYYCTFHLPNRVKARDAQRDAKYNKLHNEWLKRHDREMMILGLFGGIAGEIIKENKESIKKAIHSVLGGKG